MGMGSRPLGVTIICVFMFIFATLALLGAIGLGILGGNYSILSIVLLVMVMAYFAVAYGLWNMDYWAFLVTAILMVVAIIVEIVRFGPSTIFTVAVQVIILLYLLSIKEQFT